MKQVRKQKKEEAFEEKGYVGRYNSHFTGNSSMKPNCSFCEAEEHIATNGPKGTKIVQYHARQKFLDMDPKDGFHKLKNKGYCFQCLFPGASQVKEKHHDGMCH